MITLILLPNFKGTKCQFLKALFVCLCIDFILIGSFWFFSRENVGAQMGVYFNGNFKVWKVDTKQLNNI